MLAIEKSPTAFVTCVTSSFGSRCAASDAGVSSLQERQALEWGPNVSIYCADMRTFRPPEKADIIVSELLGSFGDNELSPECIDGAIRWLKGASSLGRYGCNG